MPSPLYPMAQEQTYEPGVFEHVAFEFAQTPCISHSLISI